VIVPDVVGLTQQGATTSLQAAGLTATSTTTSSCGTADNGKVLSQNPPGGATIAKGKNVALSICSPPVPVIVPDVVGLTQQSAIATLTKAGLTAITTTTTGCDSTDYGNVVKQDPAGSAPASPGSNVTINVCNNTAVPVP
jgi:eukaryotic-like serine/threonine-protein kinase